MDRSYLSRGSIHARGQWIAATRKRPLVHSGWPWLAHKGSSSIFLAHFTLLTVRMDHLPTKKMQKGEVKRMLRALESRVPLPERCVTPAPLPGVAGPW